MSKIIKRNGISTVKIKENLLYETAQNLANLVNTLRSASSEFRVINIYKILTANVK